MAVATIATTTTVHISWTKAAKIRMTAKIDMPEYGLTKDQIFYLVRSSENTGKYYIVTWNYEAKQWSCPCKHSVTRPTAKPCRHRKLASADCKARRNAKRATAQRLHQAIDIFLAEERAAQTTPTYGEGVQATESRLRHAGLMA